MNTLFSVNSPIVAGTLALLVLLSVVTWSIALLKLWRETQDRKLNQLFQKHFWAASSWNEAGERAQHGAGDIASLALAGFAELKALGTDRQDLMHSGAPQELLERQLRQQVENIKRHHERGLAELATIGSTAPFVGLFGTVWGIMHALQNIGQSGSASLDVVAGPIGEALIATAIGIATALPAVLAYNFFLRKLRLRVSELDNFAA
ncbi:MAG: MotA/TolQ/ExbB proton channel family protein [Gallionella sp.]|nr:MotA/TolQ/ExbB proton channel family protein [Gallionella sp.]